MSIWNLIGQSQHSKVCYFRIAGCCYESQTIVRDAVWTGGSHSVLSVIYSNVNNRVCRVRACVPGVARVARLLYECGRAKVRER